MKPFRGLQILYKKWRKSIKIMEKMNFEYGEFMGVVRKVDELGRIVLPATFRQEMGLKNKDKVEILMTTRNEIIIRKHEVEEE